MKKILVLLAITIIWNLVINVDTCKAQWVLKYYGGIYIGLEAIQFVNDNTGYIVGEEGSFSVYSSVFLKTTDGGNNWVRINMNLIYDNYLYALSFINVNTGFACGAWPFVRKTTDGGQTWVSYQVTTNTPNFNAIQFLNEQTGYIGGRYGMRAKTTNGGVNWTALDTAYTHINVIHFFDVNTGFMCDAASGIHRTTNGGATWTYKYQLDSLGSGYAFENSSFINDNTGYLIGTTYYNGCLFKTTNKGIEWSTVRTFTNGMNTVFALNSSTVYVGGYMLYVMCSTNAGIIWTNQYLPDSSTSSESIYFINANTGFSCGSYGTVCKTINGGVRVENISTKIPSSFSLSQNYPNPFNPTTTIKFAVAKSADVKVVVFDAMGREVQILVNEHLQPGVYETNFDGSQLTSGVYFYTLYLDDIIKETKRMFLIK